jgi:Acetyltransferase (GNAT) domain
MTATAATTALNVEVTSDVDAFRALEDPWRALHAACPQATPFQTWEWLFTWWEFYGPPGTLRLVTVRHDDRLVGVLPLMVTGRGRLQFVGTGLSDHLDALIDPAFGDEVLDAWIDYFNRNRGLRLIDLHEIRPEAAVWQLYARWPGRRGRYQQSPCTEMDALPLDDMFAKWTKSTRKSAHIALNRMTKNGYQLRWAAPDDIGDMAEELVARHREAWQGRTITPAHAEPRFVPFVRTMCERMVRHGGVGLIRLDPPDDADNPMQVGALMVVGREYVGGWLSADNDEARRRLSIVIAECLFGIELANRHGVSVLSLLRGFEAGKRRMYDRVKVNHRVLLGGRGVGGHASWLGRAMPAAAIGRLKRWERESVAGTRVTGRLRSVRDRFRA